ncbi:ABC-three component system middle component 6 [Streptosporangium oxazolinicum]|uniref:ABC-three component system middle component 6 n=1 Tax=Streptosporangium oxazolinicum TaxID=909287 RepID=UPI003CD07C6B
MILPNKYIQTSHSLLGQASEILVLRRQGLSVSSLWDEVRNATSISYEQFILALDLLYAINLLDINEGTLRWPS